MSTDVRKAWTGEEDAALRVLTEELGVKNWTLISKKLVERYSIKHRSSKQCRERWHNQLDPNIDKNPWTKEEDELIFALHKEFGKSWSKIADRIPGRTDNSVKNRFYTTLRRNLRKFNKSRPYSQRLIGSVRTILRNPVNADLLFQEQVPPRLKKMKELRNEEKNNEKGMKSEKFEDKKSKVSETCEALTGVAENGEKKYGGFEKVDSDALMASCTPANMNYFYFYPQALKNYKGDTAFPSFLSKFFDNGFPVRENSEGNSS